MQGECTGCCLTQLPRVSIQDVKLKTDFFSTPKLVAIEPEPAEKTKFHPFGSVLYFYRKIRVFVKVKSGRNASKLSRARCTFHEFCTSSSSRLCEFFTRFTLVTLRLRPLHRAGILILHCRIAPYFFSPPYVIYSI